MEREERFMRLALQEAEQAMALGEVPVGAVIVRGDEVVSMGHNLRETGKNALAHAEIIAINRACQAPVSYTHLGVYLLLADSSQSRTNSLACSSKVHRAGS